MTLRGSPFEPLKELLRSFVIEGVTDVAATLVSQSQSAVGVDDLGAEVECHDMLALLVPVVSHCTMAELAAFEGSGDCRCYLVKSLLLVLHFGSDRCRLLAVKVLRAMLAGGDTTVFNKMMDPTEAFGSRPLPYLLLAISKGLRLLSATGAVLGDADVREAAAKIAMGKDGAAGIWLAGAAIPAAVTYEVIRLLRDDGVAAPEHHGPSEYGIPTTHRLAKPPSPRKTQRSSDTDGAAPDHTRSDNGTPTTNRRRRHGAATAAQDSTDSWERTVQIQARGFLSEFTEIELDAEGKAPLTTSFWFGAAAQLVVDSVTVAAMNDAANLQRSGESLLCDNHQDGVTRAMVTCGSCELHLCEECDFILHLPAKKLRHTRNRVKKDGLIGIAMSESNITTKTRTFTFSTDNATLEGTLHIGQPKQQVCRVCPPDATT